MEEHLRTAHPSGAGPSNSHFSSSFAISIDERQRLGLAGTEVTPITRLNPRGSAKNTNPPPSLHSSPPITPGTLLSSSSSTPPSARTKRARSATNTMEALAGVQVGPSKRARSNLSKTHQ